MVILLAQVSLEYLILMPMLIIQIFVFPMAVGLVMDYWEDSRRELALEDVASNLGGTMQQVYLALNHATITSATLTNKLDVPPLIENYAYTGNVTLRTVLDAGLNPSKVLDITLKLADSQVSVTSSVTLGQNVIWGNSTFASNSPTACISAQKFPNGTISLSFG